jgi:imidazolonepropionase
MLVVKGCSQLVTLGGPARPRVHGELRDLAVIERGAMLVDGERIIAVGRESDVPVPHDAEVVDTAGRVVMPGFVDAHTHPVFAGNRAEEFELRATGVSYQEIAARGGGIRSTVRKTRGATEEELFDSTLRHARWFLRCGTTTIEAKSGYGLSTEEELKLLRVIAKVSSSGSIRCVPTFLGAHEIPDEFRSHPREYVDLVIQQMLPRVSSERLAESQWLPWDELDLWDFRALPARRIRIQAAGPLGRVRRGRAFPIRRRTTDRWADPFTRLERPG